MYRFTRTLNPSSLRGLPRSSLRSLHQSTPALASSYKGPNTTQGHSTDKKDDPLHRNKDAGTAAERSASAARSESESGKVSGDDQPLDTAQQGNTGGTAKKTGLEGEAKDSGFAGSLKDHRGGQDNPDKGAGVEMGGKEEAAGGSIADSVKKSLGFDKLKEMRKDGRNFHTSARELKDKMSAPKSPREPVEKSLHGDQNAHLKHKDPKAADKGKGNAAADPHLPSKKSASKDKAGAKEFHTSAVGLATKPPGGYSKAHESEAGRAGYDAPAEALPSTLDSPYSPSATPKADTDTLTPSTEKPYSSTARDPPNDALRQGALDGTLGDKNPQPNEEVGKKGNAEAWKDRK